MTMHHGRCHCGNIEIAYTSDIAPAEAAIRACQCSFCRKHQARAVSDPQGSAEIVVHDPALLNRYRFGLATADFLLCSRCGVYVGAFFEAPDGAWATLMINAFDDHAAYTRPPVAQDYGAEDAAGRQQRRRERWTPARLRLAPRPGE
jgi:hypothetical protein